MRVRQAQDQLRIFEEQVGICARRVEVQERQVERWAESIGVVGLQNPKAMRGYEIEVGHGVTRGFGLVFACKKHCDAGNKQSLRQPFDDRIDEGPKVSLRVKGTTEIDQGLTVVEALLVEDAVHPCLDGSFERIEDEAGSDDGRQQTPDAEVWEPGMDKLCREGNHAKVEADQGCRRQRIGDAAFEDQVDIHQAVAHDRPRKGERKKDEREPDQVGEESRDRNVEQKRDDVEKSERDDRE